MVVVLEQVTVVQWLQHGWLTASVSGDDLRRIWNGIFRSTLENSLILLGRSLTMDWKTHHRFRKLTAHDRRMIVLSSLDIRWICRV